MRIFIALDIDDAIRERIARFLEGVSGFTPDARWVQPGSLHVTLKFIGEKPEAAVEEIKQSLQGVRASAMDVQFQGYGFFPTAKSARVFWIGIKAGPELAALAGTIDDRMAALKIPREEHAFSPHLTLARSKGDGPHRAFQRLQEKLAAMPAPEFGTMTAREFFLYQSQLSPKGSKYTKLAGFAL